MSRSWDDPRVSSGLRRQLAARGEMLDDGAAPVGWKVGFGGPGALETLGITAPLVGFITDRTVFESGVALDTTRWENGFVEAEVAVHLASDLGAGSSPEQARAAIGAVGPAIELADLNLPLDAAQVEEIVAGDIFHRAVVLGEPDTARAGLDIDGLTARVIIDGDERAVTSDLQANTGPYPAIVSTVADTLAAFDLGLAAGDVIITRAVFPPIPIGEGTEFAFELEPFDPISVKVS